MRWLLFVCALLACKGPSSQKAEPTPAPAVADAGAPRTSTRTSEVRVDRRVELLSIVMRLSGAPEYNRAPRTRYIAAVDAHFGPHAKHTAVTLAAWLRRERGLGYDAPMTLAVHLDDRLEVANAAELPKLDERFADIDATVFAAALRDFAEVSKLDAFLAEHETYFSLLAAPVKLALDRDNPIAWFDDVFGVADASFVVVPSPIAGSGNFGTRATIAGKQTFFQILGVHSPNGLIPIGDDLIGLLVHEMAHSYINPVFARHRAAMLPAAQKIYALVEKPMRAQAYATAGTMLDESGVRAVVVNYMRDKRGDVAGAVAIRSDQRRSFYWITELAEVFRKLQRAKTRDLEAHMPQVIAFFDQLAVQYANGLPPQPFLGPVDVVHARDPVWAVATGPAATYARALHAKLRPTGTIVTATETTLADHPKRDVVAYGSPADNPVIAFVRSHARWTIEKDRIALGTTEFTGPGLVLIACWFQRDRASHGVAVYTAHDPDDLVGINGVHHGSTDWLVARKQGKDFTVLGSGDFPRGVDGAWMLPR